MWQQRSISEQQEFGLLRCSRREGLEPKYSPAAASPARPGAPEYGGGRDKALLLPLTAGLLIGFQDLSEAG